MKHGKRFLVSAITAGLSALSVSGPFVYNTNPIFAATGGKTATQAINWVKSKVGKGIDYDKLYGNQCVDLIKAYYVYLGQSQPYGNGSGYTSNSLPSGWKRYKGAQPQKGDILVYTGGYGGYGHVAIYESDYSTYHQNWSGHSYVERVTYKYNGNWDIKYWGIIRPDFVSEKSSSGTSTTKTVSVTGVTLNKTGATLSPGTTVTFSATVKPSNASNKKITWTSSNPKVATVDSSGKVKALTPGSATITAKSADGAKTAKATISVKLPTNGLAYVNGAWRYYKNGKLNTSFTGLTFCNNTWWYVSKGKLNKSFTGLVYHGSTFWYVKNGKLDKTFTGLAYHDNNWWYVKNGKLDKTFTGLTYHNNNWWYVKNGKLNKSYTGLYYHNKNWWYIKNGKLDKSYNGKVKHNNKTYSVRSGKAIV